MHPIRWLSEGTVYRGWHIGPVGALGTPLGSGWPGSQGPGKK